jgi:hypothetical protein
MQYVAGANVRSPSVKLIMKTISDRDDADGEFWIVWSP